MNTSRTPHLFYDGSCSLCRKEINHLHKRLSRHFILVDISQPEFKGWQGVDRASMMEKIHLWNGVEFLVGLDASLYYWEKVGWKLPAKLLRLPIIHSIAVSAYNLWAAWRLKKQSSCEVCVR
ncbi:MAG: DUF393 domain-containing protein [Nitrincola sp.]|nr:DUF393 domain-containing protein [Nitrincola sp.]